MIVDASVLIATANDRDPEAARCRDVLRSKLNEALVVLALALAEAAYLIQARLGPVAEIALASSLTVTPWLVEGPTHEDLLRAVGLMRQYVDLPLGLSDALGVALAERIGETTIASLDHHFRIVRPVHTEAFDVLP